MTSPDDAGYLTWGPASAKLLRTMRLEAARSGDGDVGPAHLLLALLDQPELRQALRALRQLPDIYALRARVAAASLAPAEFQESLPLSAAAEALLHAIRPHRQGEDFGLLYLLALKEALGNRACLALMALGRVDVGLLETALRRIE